MDFIYVSGEFISRLSRGGIYGVMESCAKIDNIFPHNAMLYHSSFWLLIFDCGFIASKTSNHTETT